MPKGKGSSGKGGTVVAGVSSKGYDARFHGQNKHNGRGYGKGYSSNASKKPIAGSGK